METYTGCYVLHENTQEQISTENRLSHRKSLAVDTGSRLSLGTPPSEAESNSRRCSHRLLHIHSFSQPSMHLCGCLTANESERSCHENRLIPDSARLRKLQCKCQCVNYFTVIWQRCNSFSLLTVTDWNCAFVVLCVVYLRISNYQKLRGQEISWKQNGVISDYCHRVHSSQSNKVCHQSGHWRKRTVIVWGWYCMLLSEFSDSFPRGGRYIQLEKIKKINIIAGWWLMQKLESLSQLWTTDTFASFYNLQFHVILSRSWHLRISQGLFLLWTIPLYKSESV